MGSRVIYVALIALLHQLVVLLEGELVHLLGGVGDVAEGVAAGERLGVLHGAVVGRHHYFLRVRPVQRKACA